MVDEELSAADARCEQATQESLTARVLDNYRYCPRDRVGAGSAVRVRQWVPYPPRAIASRSLAGSRDGFNQRENRLLDVRREARPAIHQTGEISIVFERFR